MILEQPLSLAQASIREDCFSLIGLVWIQIRKGPLYVFCSSSVQIQDLENCEDWLIESYRNISWLKEWILFELIWVHISKIMSPASGRRNQLVQATKTWKVFVKLSFNFNIKAEMAIFPTTPTSHPPIQPSRKVYLQIKKTTQF